MLAAALKKLMHRPVVYPPAPAGRILYAVGDIHGRADLLRRAFDRIDRDHAECAQEGEKTEIYLGDYVDRGPNSAAVLDLLIERSKVAETVFLRGNHEQVMLSFLSGGTTIEEWASLGGLPTLQSYGLSLRGEDLAKAETAAWAAIPHQHKQFLSRTHSYCRFGHYVFVHAGLRAGVPLEAQRESDLFWIREDFLHSPSDFGAVVVHGHTPVSQVDFQPNRVNIDTGAFITNRLTVLRVGTAGVSEL